MDCPQPQPWRFFFCSRHSHTLNSALSSSSDGAISHASKRDLHVVLRLKIVDVRRAFQRRLGFLPTSPGGTRQCFNFCKCFSRTLHLPTLQEGLALLGLAARLRASPTGQYTWCAALHVSRAFGTQMCIEVRGTNRPDHQVPRLAPFVPFPLSSTVAPCERGRQSPHGVSGTVEEVIDCSPGAGETKNEYTKL